MGAEVVPFGKYKGQPVEVLAADTDYCEWLTAQPWFQQRYATVYNTIINYGAEPQDSPEHNQMQVKFLDDAWCLALADHLGLRKWHGLDSARAKVAKDPNVERFRRHVELTEEDMFADDTEFEVRGWDVVFNLEPAWIKRRMTSLPDCTCRCDHSKCRADAKCHGGDGYCSHSQHQRAIEGRPGTVRTDSYHHCGDGCPWGDSKANEWLRDNCTYRASTGMRIYVELKPDLGDDYPAVLRQVNGYKGDGYGRRCVVVRRSAFQHVTWEQVSKIFAASDIYLIAESEIA